MEEVATGPLLKATEVADLVRHRQRPWDILGTTPVEYVAY